MRVLTLNPGSSSLKLAIVEDGAAVAESVVDSWDGASLRELDTLVGPRGTLDVDAVAVRVVHGGDRASPVVLTRDVLAELEQLVPLAPLHQPRSLALARHAAAALPGVPVVGCFDTSFHARLPARARTYAVPRSWRERHGVRRYGFHGLSVGYACRTAARLLGASPADLGLICAHLGAGVSVTAVDGGRSVDTSMGLTPLDGVAMATRPGALDPGIPLYLARTRDVGLAELEDALLHGSGLAGLTGTSGDIREVLRGRERGDPDAELALDVYLHRLRREIAAAAVSLPRRDAVVLTGGVAEHQPALRAELVEGAHLGLDIDPARNGSARAGCDAVISPRDAPVAVAVVACREDLELARHTEDLLVGAGPSGRRRQRRRQAHRPTTARP